MTTKLVWPATLLASFALAAACGGGSADSDGMGGEGGEDGSTTGGSSSGGSSSGGQTTGGGAGEGGMAGGGPVIVQPETCSDGEQNESETDLDCGGPDCDPCDDDATCVLPSDCESGVCTDSVCIAPECGDRVTNGDEECDDGRETDDCDADCTFAECGDGHLNSRVEECEPDPDLGIWQRCGRTCIHGVDLDGTWRTSNHPESNTPWERVVGNDAYSYYYYGSVLGLQSFHYVGQSSFYELSSNTRYDIASDSWMPLAQPLPFGTDEIWPIGAVDSEAIWVPRDGSIFRFDLADETWDEPITEVPDASTRYSSAVFDGDGFIWYAYYDSAIYDPVLYTYGTSLLVRVDPSDGSFETFSWSAEAPDFSMVYPRLAYDPVTETIIMSSYLSSMNLLRFDLEAETFSLSAPLPASPVTGLACGDRAGGFYYSASGTLEITRYDVVEDTFTPLPETPFSIEYGIAPCLVSEVGYLYVASTEIDPVTSKPAFARLRLNHH